MTLEAIAAAVIGGTSLFGGRGTVWSALIGALVIGSVSNGLDLDGQQPYVKLMVEGAILLLFVTIDALARRGRAARGLEAGVAYVEGDSQLRKSRLYPLRRPPRSFARKSETCTRHEDEPRYLGLRADGHPLRPGRLPAGARRRDDRRARSARGRRVSAT